MPVVAFAKAKSWGLSTAVLAVAAWWPPGRTMLVAELDPAGGDLAARYGLGAEPGLLSLAAAARRDLSEATVWQHVQPLPGGTPCLLGPASADQAHAAVHAVGGRLASSMDASDVDVLADCGRLGAGTPVGPVVDNASLVVLVARPSAEEIAHLASRVESLRPTGRRLGVVLVGERPYSSAEVANAVDTEILGVLADDPAGAALVSGRSSQPWGFRRSQLMRSARDVAGAVRARLAPAVAVPTSSGPAPTPQPAGTAPQPGVAGDGR
jgi:hypothetical protein